jgi:hypothetical protein
VRAPCQRNHRRLDAHRHELPAFVTLTIIDETVHENSIRMWAKWELITAVKHFRQRRDASLVDLEDERN